MISPADKVCGFKDYPYEFLYFWTSCYPHPFCDQLWEKGKLFFQGTPVIFLSRQGNQSIYLLYLWCNNRPKVAATIFIKAREKTKRFFPSVFQSQIFFILVFFKNGIAGHHFVMTLFVMFIIEIVSNYLKVRPFGLFSDMQAW